MYMPYKRSFILSNTQINNLNEFDWNRFLCLQKTYPELPSYGYAQLRIFNGVPDCHYNFTTNLPYNDNFLLHGLDVFEQIHVRVPNNTFRFEYMISNDDLDCPQLPGGVHELLDHTAYGLFLQPAHADAAIYWYVDNVEKSIAALPIVRTLANVAPERTIVWREAKRSHTEYIRTNASWHELFELQPIDIEILVDDVKVYEDHLQHGGVYALIIGGDDEPCAHMVIVTEPNTISILWIMPQYVVLTMGEVMFAVTGLEFSYAQAPVAMKTVLQAVYMLTVSVGNAIVVFVADLRAFDSQAMEFFLFAGLMFLDMLVFMWLASQYIPNDMIRNGKRVPPHTIKYVHPKYTRKAED